MAVNIAIHCRQTDESTLHYLASLANWLQPRARQLLLTSTYQAYHIPGIAGYFEAGTPLSPNTDFLLSVGGDGTFLDTVLLVKGTTIPVFGINTGRLGFLATTPSEFFAEALDQLFQGRCTIDKRSLLHLETDSDIFGENNLALNDFVLHKKDTSSMITVHAYLNGEFLNSYWADGLIVSTPTGSTGYSLSCGGPILFPDSASFAITPISPHNLNVRPVVVPDGGVVSFEVESRGNNFLLSLDARSYTTDGNLQIAVRKSDFQIAMARLHSQNYLDTLRKKMNWGHDRRN